MELEMTFKKPNTTSSYLYIHFYNLGYQNFGGNKSEEL